MPTDHVLPDNRRPSPPYYGRATSLLFPILFATPRSPFAIPDSRQVRPLHCVTVNPLAQRGPRVAWEREPAQVALNAIHAALADVARRKGIANDGVDARRVVSDLAVGGITLADLEFPALLAIYPAFVDRPLLYCPAVIMNFQTGNRIRSVAKVRLGRQKLSKHP